MKPTSHPLAPYLLTSLAMIAFAANSILNRLALIDDGNGSAIDANSFTAIRLMSGALILVLILLIKSGKLRLQRISVAHVFMLFLYAICFSFSYIDISAGTGALILFATVQLTMIGYGLIKGKRPSAQAWIGIIMAFVGLVYLLLPGVSAPPFNSAFLMIVAGLAWGIYSLAGRGIKNPIETTAWNFVGTLPLVLIALWVFQADTVLTNRGIVLAILSGALASGIGYAIWYTALPYLNAIRAATVQLTVPVIAAIGGVVFLSEPLDVRLIVSAIAVLGGVFLTIRRE